MYVTAVGQLTQSQDSYAQALQDTTFAEYLVSQAILGHGDDLLARGILESARARAGHEQQNEQFWTEVVKNQKKRFQRGFELLKDS